jgi:8-oxo-dGTP pyrophosphatase MutT (NUDIX family)
MNDSIELRKVTAFIIRDGADGPELLLFEHPFAGTQIPAGTVEVDEAPEAAALREANEETGLSEFANVRLLGSREDSMPPDQAVIAVATPVYMRPDVTTANWARLPRGITVDVKREEGDFTQVSYEETDRLIDPRYVTGHILGWVPKTALTRIKRRFFYTMDFVGQSPERWTVATDHHRFTLFWAPVRALPSIVSSQAAWLEFLTL